MTEFASGEFVAGFIAEAEEHLAAAGRRLLQLDEAARAGKTDPRAVRDLFRALHTIKGLSSMIGVEPIAEVAHAMESVLRTADRSGRGLPVAAVDLLVQGVRAIEERVALLAGGQDVPAAPKRLVDALSAIEPDAAPKEGPGGRRFLLEPEILAKLGPAETAQLNEAFEAGRPVLRVDFAPSPAQAEQGVHITSVREALTAAGEIVKVLPRAVALGDAAPTGLIFTILVITDVLAAELATRARLTAPCVSVVGATAVVDFVAAAEVEVEAIDDVGGMESRKSGVIRVEVSRLDETLEKLSALVVSRFKIERAVRDLAAKGTDVRALNGILNEHARNLRDLRAAVMQARMVSVSELLERVPLLVRGLAKQTGKAVHVRLEAGRAELDKSVAERVFPAILHLVRNAVDHAIESPAERERAGKSREGNIEVICGERSSRYLELVVKDDGRGIDRLVVGRKLGRPPPDNDAQLLEILTRPGFSTRDAVSSTSGRGVGMDVVKRITVDELGGELKVSTVVGQGTTFTLRVPLSITIVDALTFTVGDDRFVVPLPMVEEILAFEVGRVVRPPSGNGVRILEHRGEAMPLVPLGRIFGIANGTAQTSVRALVVRRNGEPVAFQVDRILGQQEVVVRPLEDPLVKVPGVTGSTDLGDGRPTLVVDLVALAAMKGGHP